MVEVSPRLVAALHELGCGGFADRTFLGRGRTFVDIATHGADPFLVVVGGVHDSLE